MNTTTKHMDLLTTENLRTLLSDRKGPCVSFFLPTHTKAESLQDPIRLKNLLKEAGKQLKQWGMNSDDTEKYLKPVADMVEDKVFWQFQSDGLALFLTPENFFHYRLPLHFESHVVVSEELYIRPVLPLFTEDRKFYILAISQGGVRLLHGSHFKVNEIQLKDVPQSLNEVLKGDEFEKSIQVHTGAGREGIFHGQGTAGDKANFKKFIIHYFRQLDNGVCDLLREENAPLVLAGVEFIRGIYREVNHYDYLLDQDIDGNPLQMKNEELHEKAWRIVEPMFQSERNEALDRFQNLYNNNKEKASTLVENIVSNAYFQMIDTLFIGRNAHCWGNFNPEANETVIHKKPEVKDTELLNFAAIHTLKNRGGVYIMEPEKMPEGAEAAAIMR